jgi:hypothetical protein
MADTKLANLTASGALTGTELFYADNGSQDVKVTASQLSAFIIGAGAVSVASGKTLTVSNTLTLAGADGKTLTVSNNLTLAGTDGSTLNVGAGGTLGTAAFVNTGTSGGTVPLLNAGNTFSATQTITPAANTPALVASGYSLTGANAQALLDLSGTWNTSGKPSALKLNITDTASNADSLLLDLQLGGATQIGGGKGTLCVGPLPATPGNNGNPGFFVSSNGAAGGPRFGWSFESGGLALRDGNNMLWFFTANAGGAFRAQASKIIGWSGTTPDGAADTGFARNAAGVVEINNGTAGTFRDLQLRALNGTSTATILSGTAIPAGGTAGSGYMFSSTVNYGLFFGSGAPTLSAAKGSLYLRSDGTTTNNRAYINADGGTTWTALTTAA